MIESKNDASRNLEKTLQALEQAKEMLMFAKRADKDRYRISICRGNQL